MKALVIIHICCLNSVYTIAQPKIADRVPIREKRGYDQRVVIDTASVRVLYALNAKDIRDEKTYFLYYNPEKNIPLPSVNVYGNYNGAMLRIIGSL